MPALEGQALGSRNSSSMELKHPRQDIICIQQAVSSDKIGKFGHDDKHLEPACCHTHPD